MYVSIMTTDHPETGVQPVPKKSCMSYVAHLKWWAVSSVQHSTGTYPIYS
jgi:hypothetical protein